MDGQSDGRVFSHSDIIAYKSNLIQALEELKYKRTESYERQVAIEKLLTEKLDVEQRLEVTADKFKHAEQTVSHLRAKLCEVTRNSGDLKYKDENEQLKIALEAAEATVSTLKKEIGMISLAKHQLEVSLKQSEQKVTVRDSRINAMSERYQSVETSAQNIMKQLRECEDTQAVLRKNVDSALAMNRDLVRAHVHSKCVLNECRKEKETVLQKLIDLEARYKIHLNSGGTSEKERMLQTEVERLKKANALTVLQFSEEKSSNEKVEANLKETKEALRKAYKIIGCTTSDDKNVIEMEMQLKELEKLNQELERKSKSISIEFDTYKGAKEDEISKSLKECEDLKKQLEERKHEENILKQELLKFKEIKLSMQELQIRFDSVVGQNETLKADLSSRDDRMRNLISDVEELRKETRITEHRQCQTENTNKTVCIDCESQTENEIRDGYWKLNETVIPVDETSPPLLVSCSPVSGNTNAASSTSKIAVAVKEGLAGHNHEDPHVCSTLAGSSPAGRMVLAEQCVAISVPMDVRDHDLISHSGNVKDCSKSGVVDDIAENVVYSGLSSESNVEKEIASTPLPMTETGNDYRKEHLQPTVFEQLASKKSDATSKATKFKTPFVRSDNIISVGKNIPVSMPLNVGSIILNAKSLESETSATTSMETVKLDSEDTAGKSTSLMSISFHTTATYSESPKPVVTCLKSPVSRGKDCEDTINILDENSSNVEEVSSKNLNAPENLEPVSPVLSPCAKEEHQFISRRRSLNRKRKLTCTPPMLDASQSSVVECAELCDDASPKQVSLRVPKNFTKQVLLEKPLSKLRTVRYKPLDLLPGGSGAVNHSSKQPYTKLDAFRGVYSALKDKFARIKCQQESSDPVGFSESLPLIGVSSLVSSHNEIGDFQSNDGDEERIEISESEESA